MVKNTSRPRNHRTQWTLAEIAYVEEHYGRLSVHEIGEALGRSANGVNRIVQLAGLSQQASAPWTEQEHALVREHYRDGIEGLMPRLPGRTKQAIIRQAALLGLTDSGGWSLQEKTFLEKHYGKLPTQAIATRLGRSVSAVRGMVFKLGLSKAQKQLWTESELLLLQEHYANGPASVQAVLPGRSRGAIVAQAGKMGLTDFGLWQTDEIRILQQWYPTLGLKVLSRLPGRSRAAIKGQVVKLGLRYRNKKKRQTPMRRWRTEDLQLLEDNLTVPAKALLALFPGRTAGAIDAKKSALKRMRKRTGGNRATLPLKTPPD